MLTERQCRIEEEVTEAPSPRELSALALTEGVVLLLASTPIIPSFIHTKIHPHPVNSVDNPPKSATIFPLKEGIISPSMEYNHEGEKYSTHQVEKVTLYPQNIHP
ncbi:MAG: hypothetical protein IJ392_06395 [Clostridia bacterium]|nr:hypothetical protein [Clostridia bacterium]